MKLALHLGKSNRAAHEDAAGMGLEPSFFAMNGIDPDAPYIDEPPRRGDLVLTHDGYFGLIVSINEPFLVFLANGLSTVYTLKQLYRLPLGAGATAPANFAELLR